MSRGRRLLKGSFLRVTSLVIQIIISFFMMPFLISSLGEEHYGLWTLVATFIGYYSLLDLGLSSAAGRFIARTYGDDDVDERRRIVSTTFYIYLVLGLVAFILTLGFSIFAHSFVKETADASLFRVLVLLIGLTMAISFPLKVFASVLNSNLRYDLIQTVVIFKGIASSIAMVIAIKSGYGVLGIAVVTAIFSTMKDFILVILAVGSSTGISIHPRYFSAKDVKVLFSYSVYAFVSQIADVLKYKIDSFLIARFISLGAVTHYNIALRLIEYMQQFIFSTINVISPVFSQDEGRNDFDGIRKKFFITTKISSYIALYLGGMSICYGSPFILRWMGPQFDSSYSVLAILCFPVVMGLAQTPIFNVLYGISRHRIIAYTNICEGIANLLISLILVRAYGIFGVAIGTFIPMTITTLLLYPLFICHVLEIRPLYYFVFIMRRSLIVLFPLVSYYLLIKNYILKEYFSIMYLSLGHSIVVAAFVYMFGFEKKERQYLLSYIWKK